MRNFLLEKNVRIRCKKSYPQAHSHVLIGRVVEENDRYLAVEGRTFHFHRISPKLRGQVYSGETMVRVIPWGNIEVVHWISEKTDWNSDFAFDAAGNLVLRDKAGTVIAARQEEQE